MYDTRSKELNRTVFFLDVTSTVGTFLLSFWARNFFPLGEGELNIYSPSFSCPCC